MTAQIHENFVPTLVERIQKDLPVGARILDIGCSTCPEGEDLLKAGFFLTLLDQDGETMDRVRSRLPGAAVLTGDAAHLLTEGFGTFDAILLRRPDVLHRPLDWEEIFQRLPEVLKTGGTVYITTAGESEAGTIQRWLDRLGAATTRQETGVQEEVCLMVAHNLQKIEKTNEEAQRDALIAALSFEDNTPHMVCDLRTGRCTMVGGNDNETVSQE